MPCANTHCGHDSLAGIQVRNLGFLANLLMYAFSIFRFREPFGWLLCLFQDCRHAGTYLALLTRCVDDRLFPGSQYCVTCWWQWCPLRMTTRIQVELMCFTVDEVADGYPVGERFVVYNHFMTFRFQCSDHNDSNIVQNQGLGCYADKWWCGLQPQHEPTGLQITRWTLSCFATKSRWPSLLSRYSGRKWESLPVVPLLKILCLHMYLVCFSGSW